MEATEMEAAAIKIYKRQNSPSACVEDETCVF
jgi:hypothetical protein